MNTHFKIPTITVNEDYISIFSEESFPEEVKGGMLLTERINAQNFRLRESKASYKADWHIAGDATLIIVQKGVLRITLQNKSYRDFKAGEMFIAKDDLPSDVSFNSDIDP